MTTQASVVNGQFPRQRAYRLVVAAAACALVLGALAPGAAAAVRWVNDDAASYAPPGTNCDNAGYSTIQGAVNAAGQGDTIRVCPGAYIENVAINTPHLNVISTVGPAATVVTAAASAHVFEITAPGVTLRGLTIVPAGFGDGDIGVNVAIDGAARARILENAIQGGRIGVNLGCASFGSLLANNTVNGQTEGGINIDTCEVAPFPGSHDNSIHHNVACSTTATGSIALGGSSNDNSIHDNIATKISVFGAGNLIKQNTTQIVIVDNGVNTLSNNVADPGVCSAACP